ncbi:MAG: hypothetical protein ACK41U_08005 [Paracoccus sp. (in: a-proteobacteria)]|uniref:hypothetical protein n=1 Tax=Paracoccus sp. TaxID=267 RepID=UPI00391960AB
MPNHSKIEQDLLDPEQLELIAQSRSPALGRLDDAEVHDLLDRLRAARDAAKATPPTDGPGPNPADMMRAALRRVDAERRRRGLATMPETVKSAPPAKHPPAMQPDDMPAASPAAAAKPAAAANPKLTPPAATRRKAAASRKPAGRKSTEARKTDLRTEPHRIKKPHPAATVAEASVNDHLHVTRDNKMTMTDAEKAAKQAARKAEKETAKAAEKAAAKAERQAAKAAEKEARRAARKTEKAAEKEAAKAERKAARKAEKQAEKTGEAKPKSKEKAKSEDGAAKPAKTGNKVKPSGGKAGKTAKDK